ncbi:hypothetical protein FVR03_09265 [Pontibacter qinzhouensis]|uniref:PorT family protein n=1 Tax=Pontibacter qinzhouensis TaxID=2603253 RepID=A0A5C8KBI3_9BACT|nr:hypothetical protein [Pontibacter qinzhouensis]TXK47571.1 hypothetical protein FVR03_09265 [Pontibacter qinzhouensis]
MKKVMLLAVSLVAFSTAFAQKTEFSLQANTGVYRFSGSSAESSTTVQYITQQSGWNYTHNPHGNKLTLSLGVAGQVQRVTRGNVVLGLQAGAEFLQSKVNITGAYSFWHMANSSLTYVAADGRSFFQHKFINVHPFLGRRLSVGPIAVDVTAGSDIGFCLQSTDNAKLKVANGEELAFKAERDKPSVDLRPRVGVTGYFRHIGVTASYAHGLTNYLGSYDGGNPEAYARVLRLGLLYRL